MSLCIEEIHMDTDTIRWIVGAVLIAIGVPFFYLGNYLSAPEDRKKQKAAEIKLLGLIWMVAGVLLYVTVLVAN
jgi:uncharacterized protein YjeT (DUF2065 family)